MVLSGKEREMREVSKNRTVKILLAVILSIALIMTPSIPFMTDTAKAASAAGGSASITSTSGKVGDTISVTMERTAPEGMVIFSLSGYFIWDTSALKIVSITGTNGITPVTIEDFNGAKELANESPKAVTAMFSASPASTKFTATFKVLKTPYSAVQWKFKPKGDGIQANVGDPKTNTGAYASGPVPISVVSGLAADGTVDNSTDTVKTTAKQTVATGKFMLARAVTKGSKANKISWTKVSGADGYIVYAAKAKKKYKFKTYKTVSSKTLSVTKKKLKKGSKYKYYVAAYQNVDGQKVITGKSPAVYSIAGNKDKKYANVTKVKVSKKR